EPGTTLKLDIEQDLTQVKTAITTFVDAYNAVKQFINKQNLTTEDGQKNEDAGALYGSRTMADVESAISRLIGQGTSGVDGAVRVLAQIGVTFVNNNALTDPLLADTLKIDES